MKNDWNDYYFEDSPMIINFLSIDYLLIVLSAKMLIYKVVTKAVR